MNEAYHGFFFSLTKEAKSTFLEKVLGKPSPKVQEELKRIAKKKGKTVKELSGKDFPLLPKKM